tara:strand:+ start:210 stop:374 length:165 start_codon:yes stop_codon:yes gene_type:complete
MFLLVQSSDSRLSFSIAAHLNKTKAFASAAIAISDDLGAFNRAKLRKQVFQVRT